MSDPHTSCAESPFGHSVTVIDELSVGYVADVYRKKCGADVRRYLEPANSIKLYRCNVTGYMFWRPKQVAGPEDFYHLLSSKWPDYYRETRWEYPAALRALRGRREVLEIGCGRGYFLHSAESVVQDGLGLEMNLQAIQGKVTRFPIVNRLIEDVQSDGRTFDAVCAFQVLEHIVDPASFLRLALGALRPGGLLILSTPNADCTDRAHRDDAFDLPPHHMGRFNAEIFGKIAHEFGLEVVAIKAERRRHSTEEVSALAQKSVVFRMARWVARLAYDAAFRITNEPGGNILTILRKPH